MRFKFWKRKPVVENEGRILNIVLYGCPNIDELTLRGISERSYKFIQNNIGRDEIFIHNDISVNLRNFSIIKCLPDDRMSNTAR